MRAAGATSVSNELPDCFSAFEAELEFVYRMLRRYGASPPDADDLTQEVFLVVWRRWRDYDPGRPLRPWLAGITYRVAHDHFRRRRREVPSGIVDVEEQTSPLEQLASARARALVLRALASLPERQRAILILHELEGIPIPELTGTLLVPASTLYSRLKKAHQNFARSVRRLQRGPATPAPAPIEVEELLATERTPRPEAPERRRRVMARIRALMAEPRPPLPPAPRSTPAWPMLIAAGVIAVGVAAWLSRGHAPHVVRPTIAAVAPREQSLPAKAGPRLEEGLVGYWRFDEGAGTVARDRSGNGTDCAFRQMSPASAWTDGPLGGALEFGGLGWMSCPQPRFAGSSSDLSVAAWVKRTSSPRGYHAIVTRQVRDTNLDHFFLGFRGDLIFFVSHLWGGKIHYPAPPLDHWFHLAVVHGDGHVVLFVDGQEVARAPTYDHRPAATDTPLTIGGGVNGPDPELAKQRLVGAIDELAIYGRQLSVDEVMALARGVRPR